MIRRDRKGRFSYEKSPALLAEQALLVRVRSMLSAFGADISEGGASVRNGIDIALSTPRAGLAYEIFNALAPIVPAGRELRVLAYEGHAGRIRYSVNVLPAKHDLSQSTPAAPSLGGPREVSA